MNKARSAKRPGKSRGDRNIAWVEKFCLVPEGKDVGKPVVLRDWQRDEVRRIYDNPHGTRTAIISFARKNGKTALVAFLLLLHLCGPEAKPNSQLYSGAQSKEQAGALFNLAAKVVRLSPELNEFVGIRDTQKVLYCPDLGTTYEALSAEAKTSHGKSPIFIVHDELGQVRGPNFPLYSVLESGTGAHEAPLSIIISTQAPNPGDLLSMLIDDALTGRDPHTVVSVYAAPDDMDPFSEEAWKLANPAYGDFRRATDVRDEANKAKALPSLEPEFRNLYLNQRVEMFAPFITRTIWEACNATPADFDGLPVYGGLDLSAVSDLTALVYVAPLDGVWQTRPKFWLPSEGLAEKSRADRVPYDVWAKQGHLLTTPGRTIEYEYVAAQIFADCQRMDVRKIAFDRWNYKNLKPWLAKAGFRPEQLDGDDAIFAEFGQGFASMSPALRALESAVLTGNIAHGAHPVLTMCMANAVVTTNPAGDRKLDKAKASGRIDGAVALAMAIGTAEAEYDEKPVLTIAGMIG